MNLQCPQCGEIQSFDSAAPHCIKCGNPLSKDDTLILKNPRRGRGMLATAIIMLICCVAVFFFYSKFWGGWGAVIGALVYVWGQYKVKRNRKVGMVKNGDQGKP